MLRNKNDIFSKKISFFTNMDKLNKDLINLVMEYSTDFKPKYGEMYIEKGFIMRKTERFNFKKYSDLGSEWNKTIIYKLSKIKTYQYMGLDPQDDDIFLVFKNFYSGINVLEMSYLDFISLLASDINIYQELLSIIDCCKKNTYIDDDNITDNDISHCFPKKIRKIYEKIDNFSFRDYEKWLKWEKIQSCIEDRDIIVLPERMIVGDNMERDWFRFLLLKKLEVIMDLDLFDLPSEYVVEIHLYNKIVSFIEKIV